MEKILYSLKDVNGKIVLEYLIPATMLRNEISRESVVQALAQAAITPTVDS